MLTSAISVWTTEDPDQRLALLDLGTLYHRGTSAPIPLQLFNSRGADGAPAMRQVELAAIGHDAHSVALLQAGALYIWYEEWHDLTAPVGLPDMAPGAAITLWLQCNLPTVLESAPEAGRFYGELLVTWEE
ncbi:MAG: hypothetical protein GEEBNDBF_01387 [bacterium]|nr:hypothetical protein [bacterium]